MYRCLHTPHNWGRYRRSMNRFKHTRSAGVAAKIARMMRLSVRCVMTGCTPMPMELANSAQVTAKPVTRIKTASLSRKGRLSMVLWWWIVGLAVAHATPLPHSFAHHVRNITSCKEATVTNVQRVASNARTHRLVPIASTGSRW